MPSPTPELVPAMNRGGVGRVRWTICALLFSATTINYINRQIIGVLKPSMSHDLGWSEIDYANIIVAFQFAYALGYLLAGRVIDLVGVKTGFALAGLIWSVAAMGHAWVSVLAGFYLVRFVLGLAEGANFPAAIKAVTEWFPKQERALATGVFNAGSNIGAIITPLSIPWVTAKYGWRVAFLAAGSLGLVWLLAWWMFYESPDRHSKLSEAERAYIRGGPAEAPVRISWLRLLAYRQTWAFIVGMFFTAPIWWFYLFWIPGFLHDRHHLDLLDLGLPLAAIYLLADFGSILGGWYSSRLIARGCSINRARKITMLLCAACVVPVFSAPLIPNLWGATLIIGLAAAAHQGWGVNLYTLVSDTAPRQYVGSIVGLGGLAGGIGGMLIAKLAGTVLQISGSYLSLFIIAAAAYPFALLVIHLLNPRLEPMHSAATATV